MRKYLHKKNCEKLKTLNLTLVEWMHSLSVSAQQEFFWIECFVIQMQSQEN